MLHHSFLCQHGGRETSIHSVIYFLKFQWDLLLWYDGKQQVIWSKLNNHKLLKDSCGEKKIASYMDLNTKYAAILFFKICVEFKTLEFWVGRKWPLKAYSYVFCLDWQRHINELFCEKIDTKEPVDLLVSMTTVMLDGIYPSCMIHKHLVS